MKNKTFISFFSVLLIIYPLLSSYLIVGNSFTYGDFALLILLVLGLFNMFKKKVRINYNLLPMFIYIITVFCVLIFLNIYFNPIDIFFRMTRYLLYIFILIVFVDSFFDKDKGLEIYKKIALIASIYLLLQYFSLIFFNFYLPGHFTFLKLNRESIYNLQTLIYQNTRYLRPRSFFGEPSEFAIFMLPLIVYMLFDKNKKDIFAAVFISISIIVSTSFIGFASLMIIWSLYLIDSFRSQKFLVTLLLSIPILFVLVIIFPDQIMGILNRMISGDIFDSERIRNILMYPSSNDFYISVNLFGTGMIDFGREIFVPGLTRFYYYFGIIGLLIFLCSISFNFLNTNKVSRIIIFLFLFISVFDVLVLGKMFMLYWLFINKNKRGINYER